MTKPASQRSAASAAARPQVSNIKRRRGEALQNKLIGYQERRHEIAKAAAHVFNKQGFRGTSLRAVADALGMSRAALYYYIGNKRELFDEVVSEVVEANVVAAEEVHLTDASAIDKLRTLIVELMKLYGTHYPLLYIALRENLTHVGGKRSDWSRAVRKLNQRYEKVFIEIVQEGIDAGTLRSVGSAKMVAYGIIGMIGWTNRWFVPDKSAQSAEEIGTIFADMVLDGLVAKDARPRNLNGANRAGSGADAGPDAGPE